MYISIPTYSNETKEWSYTNFETRDEFKKFVWTKFIPPGEIKLKNTFSWRQQAYNFEQLGYYCKAPSMTKDFLNYWNFEKEKSTKGVIIDDFYLTPYYYFWINFLPINDKKVNKLKFPEIWDSQYYFFIYEYLCELEYKYSVVVKKRQWGGTFQHLAILINDIWFKEGYINKIAAYDEEFIKADWSMLEEYRNFLNANTAWYRGFNPDKTFNWQQRWETKKAGKKVYVGNKSIIKGLNLRLSASKGVGGKNNKFYYEEAGITKHMSTTFGYIDPALKLGALTTGIFMASGSVGELDQCEELKKMALKPDGYNILSVKNVFEDNPDINDICFFVPEYWSMPPFIDADGNSLVEEAKAWCLQERERLKISAAPEDYRHHVSQHPFNLAEAFAWRKDSIFPQAKIIKQQETLLFEGSKGVPVTLEYDSNGKIIHKITDKLPISKFPLDPKDNKEGSIIVWEYPIENPKWLTYFAGIDPIAIDKTNTSVSLFSIYIFKNLTETIKKDNEQTKIIVDGYRPVACYVGRYDDLTKVNEIAEKLLVWYNALAAVENNVMSFINHMQQRGLQRYLATKDSLSFVSELKTNLNVFSPYGFKMNQTIKTYFIDIINEYLNEELDVIKLPDGKVVKTIYGVERIRDTVFLEELKQYHDKLNVDRFVAFGAGLALMKAHRKHGIGVSKIDETTEKKPVISEIQRERGFFRRLDTSDPFSPKMKNYFKNYK